MTNNTIVKHVAIDEIIESSENWMLLGFDDDTMIDLWLDESANKRPKVGDRCTLFMHKAPDGVIVTHGFAWGERLCWGDVHPDPLYDDF